MTTSQKHNLKITGGQSDTEWQTPVVSQNFQSRFRCRLSSRDTGLGSSDDTEDFCSTRSSQTFQPIQSQIPIPTAHVMPTTAGILGLKSKPSDDVLPSSSSSSSKSSLTKSVSFPNLDNQHEDNPDGVKPDCLSRYRSLVNHLDHSLFPSGDLTRLDETQKFDVPAMEPTFNQSVLLQGLSSDVCQQQQQTYEALPNKPCGKLDNWQEQKLKMESFQLQMEQLQLMSGGRGPYLQIYPSHLNENSKWEVMSKASENLLKEKELTIERLRQQNCQQELRLRESELQIHSALSRGAPLPELCLLRLQEAQQENAFLRKLFTERSDCFSKEKLEADRRLGAVETELQCMSDTLKEKADKHAEELKKREERIRSRDKHINSLKKKCQMETDLNREKQQRIETLERYVADLPSMEEYQSQHKKLEEMEDKAARLEAMARDLEAQLEEARAAVRSKEGQLEEQTRKERELLTKVTSLQDRVQESLEDGVRLPSLDMEKLQEENATLKDEQQRLKKVVEKQLRLMQQLSSQIKESEEQLLQEESCSQALREEVAEKEEGLLQLQNAMKELSVQNQELMEQNLTLQERIQGDEPASGCHLVPVGAQLTQKLYGELSACLSDLRCLCNVLTQRAQGRNPNLSMLLGIASPPPVQWEDWLSSEGLQKKLHEAQQLRRDVEELRTIVSDRYAQDMGENCITQ